MKKLITPLLLLASIFMVTLAGCSDETGELYIKFTDPTDSSTRVAIYTLDNADYSIYGETYSFGIADFKFNLLPGSYRAAIYNRKVSDKDADCCFQIVKGEKTNLTYDTKKHTLTWDVK
jgi:hypothetical protein